MATELNIERLSIKEYADLVSKCARERINLPIPNGSPEHARVLIAKLFDTARKDVWLLSGMLTDITTKERAEIYGHKEVIENAVEFLRRPNSSLRIILQKPLHLGDNNRLIKAIKEDAQRRGDVTIYMANEDTNRKSPPHFMVNDALAYRFEQDDAAVRAVANFGDEKTAKVLTRFFGSLASYLTSANPSAIQRFKAASLA